MDQFLQLSAEYETSQIKHSMEMCLCILIPLNLSYSHHTRNRHKHEPCFFREKIVWTVSEIKKLLMNMKNKTLT